jgi:hypothetical protein
MSTIAIKNFFNHQREVTARRNAYRKRLLEEMNKVHEYVVDTTALDKEVEYIDFLLKRNWFLDGESISDLLLDASEDAFQVIVKQVNTYPLNVRDCIYSFLPLPIGNVKLKVLNLTNEQMDLREFKEQERLRKQLSDAWEAYKVEKNLEPPVGNLDAELDDLFACLQQLKKDLEDAKKKSLAGRYVPPAIRDKIVTEDPRVVEVSKKIETVENEIIRQNRYIEQEKHGWFMRKQNEFEQTMLSV